MRDENMKHGAKISPLAAVFTIFIVIITIAIYFWRSTGTPEANPNLERMVQSEPMPLPPKIAAKLGIVLPTAVKPHFALKSSAIHDAHR